MQPVRSRRGGLSHFRAVPLTLMHPVVLGENTYSIYLSPKRNQPPPYATSRCCKCYFSLVALLPVCYAPQNNGAGSSDPAPLFHNAVCSVQRNAASFSQYCVQLLIVCSQHTFWSRYYIFLPCSSQSGTKHANRGLLAACFHVPSSGRLQVAPAQTLPQPHKRRVWSQ